MKYIKLFENFNNEEDILYDIEDILTVLNPPSTGSSKPELLRNELNGNLLFYKVEHNYTIEENVNFKDEKGILQTKTCPLTSFIRWRYAEGALDKTLSDKLNELGVELDTKKIVSKIF